eukprot:1198577-Pleurochrysis_carterae.AAC.1
MERGVRIFDEFFDKLARAASRRRTRAGAAALDIAALVKELFDSGLESARRAELTIRTAEAAASRVLAAGGGAVAAGPP